MTVHSTNDHQPPDLDLDSNSEIWAVIEREVPRRLLVSALSAFAARGFHAATTREIGEGAGLSAAGVYVYFKSKNDLLYEICRLGQQASLDDTEAALEAATDDSVERLHAYVSAHTRWHCEHHTLARVIQYEFRALPTQQHRSLVPLRNRFEQRMRETLKAGVTQGVFDVPDLQATTLAILSLSIDLARWYRPGVGQSPLAVSELYAELVLRMVGAPSSGRLQAVQSTTPSLPASSSPSSNLFHTTPNGAQEPSARY